MPDSFSIPEDLVGKLQTMAKKQRKTAEELLLEIVREYPSGINDREQIVGSYDISPFQQHGFLLDRRDFTIVDIPGVNHTALSGINGQGDAVGIYYDSLGAIRIHGFVLTAGNIGNIDFPGVVDTSANGINNSGQIVGGFDDGSAGHSHSFILSEGHFIMIDPPGAFSSFATGINDKGQVVGSYYDQSGSHGFLATPVPEPSSTLAVIVCLYGILVFGQGWPRGARRGDS